jgi:two-component system chemotaxis sensor kinase CheA
MKVILPGNNDKENVTMDSTTLLQDFIAETEEHLEEMESNLLRLELDPHNREILNEIFRSVHTIKGSAEYLGVERIAELSHKLENLLELLRHGKRPLNKEIVEALMGARDRISKLIKDLERVQVEETGIEDLVKRLDQLNPGENDLQGRQTSGAPSEGHPDKATDLSAPLDDLEGIFDEEAQKNFSILVEALSEIAHENVGQESKERLLKGFDEFIRISRYIEHDDLIPNLEKLRKQGERIASPGEAVELLADLKRFKDLLPCLKTVASTHDRPPQASHLSATPGRVDRASEPIRRGMNDPVQDFFPQGEQDQISEEEHDQELFGIFIQHLKDQISFLKAQVEKLQKSNSGVEPLQECLDCIKRLKSSANYMDYKKLVLLYEKWAVEIKQIQDRRSRGEGVSFQFMDAYLEEIYKLFPQCGKPREERDNVKTAERPIEVPTSDVALLVETELVVDPLTLAPDSTPLERDLLNELECMLTPRQEGPKTLESGPVPKKTNQPPVAQSETHLLKPSSRPSGGKEPPGAEDIQDHSEGFKSEEKPGLQQGLPIEPVSDEPVEKVIKHNLRVDTKKIDALMNQVGELVVNRAWFSQLATDVRELQRQLQESRKLDQKESKQLKGFSFKINEAALALGRVVNELQEGVMKVRMLPIAELFGRYPRLVRNLTEETEKRVRLAISGEETELDKMVIEEVSDPLIHIIRNAVDHGIEPVEERRRLKKAEEGQIRLSAYHESNHVVIEVEDDGRGIDPKLLKETSIAKGLFTENEMDRMTPKELLGLIMKPGFSTATQVTKTSGRGVGMDVVKKNIEKLNGTIEIDSTVGVGTRFRIKIPLTLAIIQALLVRVGPETFTIPLTSVVETLRFFRKEIDTIEEVEVIHLRNTTIPLLRLSEIFRLPAAVQDSGKAFVVIISTGLKQVGLVVDSLVGEQEVVIKPLVDYLQENSGFSGATILGDGRISLILDVYELQKLAISKKAKKSHNKGMFIPADNLHAEKELSRIRE